MNWEAIGAIGDLLGSIAVFITLAYLAVQVRHARAEVRRSISQSRADMLREINLNRLNNERLFAVYGKVNAAFARQRPPFFVKLMEQTNLTEEEAALLFEEQWLYWRYRAHVISYIDELPVGERVEFDGGTRSQYASNPWAALWYNSMKSILNPDAVRYIDKLLAEPHP